ncbi:hypothetical protein HCN44_010777 [Aphidius gifuensis]|uniref:DNA polymerase epsilon subunit n=1 Tax=Aphidius gifuensis TaxID=684658 RepID=A0A834XSF6_APHGI|nr:hypothetical protein HCN44_010777 [Aphidius gifuensis]
MSNLLKTVQSTFSMYGFIIRRDLSNYVVGQLQCVDEDERDTWLTKITDQLTSLNLTDPHITKEHIDQAIRECIRPDTNLNENEKIFNVISIIDIPKITYDIVRKKFQLEKIKPDYYSDADCKTNLYKNRLNLLKYRTLRHEAFEPKKFGETDVDKFNLVPVEYLLTNTKNGEVYVMGLLSQLVEGKYFLEDQGAGVITEGTIVIVNGLYEDGILEVKKIGLPPAEPSEVSRAPFGTENTFGGTSKISLKLSEKLKNHEESRISEMMVILSDVWLDDPVILSKLRIIFDGYSDDAPIAFILCGNFLSFAPNVTSADKLKEGFNKLADIIQDYPDIKKYSKFVFVPGPQDIFAPKILPKAPLPEYLLDTFIKSIPGTFLAYNPCRIQYCTKEIVVFREDMIAKLSRNTLKFPEKGQLYEHYARTMVCQSHLAPMTLPVVPVYWKHDHALQLFPTPDLIVVADSSQSYTTSYADCKVINPGSFPKNKFSFKVYKPGMDEIEDCELPDDNDD